MTSSLYWRQQSAVAAVSPQRVTDPGVNIWLAYSQSINELQLQSVRLLSVACEVILSTNLTLSDLRRVSLRVGKIMASRNDTHVAKRVGLCGRRHSKARAGRERSEVLAVDRLQCRSKSRKPRIMHACLAGT